MNCTSSNKAHGLYPFPNRNLLRSLQYTKVKMNLTHPTIGPYHRFQYATEASKKWYIIAWKHFLKSLVCSMSHSMVRVFVKSGLRNMLFWRSLIKFKLIWMERCTPAGHSRPHNAFEETWPLYNYAVHGIVNDLFTSYLTGRKQITGIGPLNRCRKATVSSGVPQGSVLGPLPFFV